MTPISQMRTLRHRASWAQGTLVSSRNEIWTQVSLTADPVFKWLVLMFACLFLFLPFTDKNVKKLCFWEHHLRSIENHIKNGIHFYGGFKERNSALNNLDKYRELLRNCVSLVAESGALLRMSLCRYSPVKMRSRRWDSGQGDWCPYKKETSGYWVGPTEKEDCTRKHGENATWCLERSHHKPRNVWDC